MGLVLVTGVGPGSYTRGTGVNVTLPGERIRTRGTENLSGAPVLISKGALSSYYYPEVASVSGNIVTVLFYDHRSGHTEAANATDLSGVEFTLLADTV